VQVDETTDFIVRKYLRPIKFLNQRSRFTSHLITTKFISPNVRKLSRIHDPTLGIVSSSSTLLIFKRRPPPFFEARVFREASGFQKTEMGLGQICKCSMFFSLHLIESFARPGVNVINLFFTSRLLHNKLECFSLIYI
jgi:hypothetical protein